MTFDPDNPVTAEIKRLADRLRAGKRAALADPNLHPLRRKMFEASLAAAEAEDREDARQRAFEEAQRAKPPRTRRPSVTQRIRQVSKAGLTITAVHPDGTLITAKPGEPGEAKPDSGNEWDTVLQ